LQRSPAYDEEIFEMQENRKEAFVARLEARNEWILNNKRIGSFDIETTDLAANFGTIVCACIKELGGGTATFVTRGDSDKRTAERIRDELRQYDYITTWYGAKFDMPFLTTRLLINEADPLGALRHLDLYYTARFKLRLHSNRLDCVTEALYGESGKTRLNPEMRLGLRSVSPTKRNAAIEYHVEHCQIDVDELEKLFVKLAPYRDLGATQLRRF
jgi:uncharacterized protein YprB with RNaseH-like and TPR domain